MSQECLAADIAARGAPETSRCLLRTALGLLPFLIAELNHPKFHRVRLGLPALLRLRSTSPALLLPLLAVSATPDAQAQANTPAVLAITRYAYVKKARNNAFEVAWTQSPAAPYAVTGLTNGMDDRYMVQVANATVASTKSNASDAVTSSSATLTVSGITHNSASLNIAGAGSNWYLKRVTPADTACMNITSTSTNLSLSGNTNYTYNAYSDNGCTTELDSVSFLTPPGKPSKPVSVEAGIGRLTVTSSVTGSGTLIKWQYKRIEERRSLDANWRDLNETSTSLSHTFTGLKSGTWYQFKVRAVNATDNGLESANSVSVPTLASRLETAYITSNSALLALSNYNGIWSMKRTTPTASTCTNKGYTTFSCLCDYESLSNLSSNTEYTYEVYSGNSCGTFLGSTSFVTKPGKPAKPVLTKAGSGKLTITSSVTGSGTLSKWQYKRKVGTGNFDTSWTDISETSTSLSHTFSGLTNGISYQYKVRAVNGNGESAESDASDAVQPGTVMLSASLVEDDTATLTLSSYVFSTGWYYKYTVPATGGVCSGKQTSSSANLTGLDGNTNYTYKAYNDSGCSTDVASEDFLTKPGQPSKPVAVKAGSTKLHMTSSVTGSSTPTKWQYKRKADAGNFDANWSDIASSATKTLSHTFSGLTNGTSYQYKLRAMNATGDGLESDASDAVSPGAATLTASAKGSNTATLTLAGYGVNWWLKRTAPTDGTCKSKGTTLTEDLTSLAGNTSYTYKAYSDSSCSTELASEDFLTKPGQPAKPVSVKAGSGKLRVTSSVTGSGTPTKWQYKRKAGAGNFDANWIDITSSATKALSYTFTGLTNGTSYQYKLRAVNATGDGLESDASDAVSPGVATLSASSVEDDTATLALAGFEVNWWLKRTTPTGDDTCTSEGTTLTEDLTGLDSNTNYTYKAYSDSSCSTEVASEDFLTKPGKPSKPVLLKAGSQRLRVTSSVTGTGILTKWQFKRKVGTGNFDANWTDIRDSSTILFNSFQRTTLSSVIYTQDNIKTHQYKFRVANATGVGLESDASDAVQSGLATLSASLVEDDTATLMLAGIEVNWWLKRTTPTGDDTCTSKGTTLTEDLTGLNSNTNYTYKAYSDSSCSTEVASEDFLTKPGKPSKPVLVQAGSSKLKVTSSVTGTGTLTKWQYKRKVGTGNFDANWIDIASSATKTLSHTFSGLTDGTDYQYKVRAVNVTGVGLESDASDAAQPGSPTLIASNVTATGATITIGNYDLAWWYKSNQANASCTSVPAGTTTAILSGLDSGTSYVYKAYSKPDCSATNLIATSESFTTLGLILSASSGSFNEGATKNYTLKLSTKPTADVTVTLSSADTDAVSVSPTKLIFTTKNWNTAQTVTLTGVQDDDGENEVVLITTTPANGGYDSVKAVTYTATVTDNDSKALALSASSGSFNEGATKNYTLKLSTKPTADVTVTLSSADTDAVSVSPTKLTFSTSNWSTAQMVTLTGVQDDDGENEAVLITATPANGGYNSVKAVTYTATVTDDDSKGLTSSASSGSFNEGATKNYTLKLSTKPTADVTVNLSSADKGAVSVSPTKLTFSTSNWSTAQTVTLTGVQDDDGENEVVLITATPANGGYDDVKAVTYTATVADDDIKGLTLSANSGSFNEGATRNYTLKLSTKPTADVTVTLSSADKDAVSVSPTKLTFTTKNWNTSQTVTLTGVQDDDGENEVVLITATPANGGYNSVKVVTYTATVTDDDSKGLTLSASSGSFKEGATKNYTVKLATLPTGKVTVTLSSADTDAVTVSPATLTFTTKNWNTAQTVMLTGAQDDDGENEGVTVKATPSGGGYGKSEMETYTATVRDDDSKDLTLSTSGGSFAEGATETYTMKLATLPTGKVTITLSSADTDAVTVSPATLTFTTKNWNTAQTVTLTGVQDDDGENEDVTVKATPSGGGYGKSEVQTYRATVRDDDSKDLTLSTSGGSFAEGATETYTVKLATLPTGKVTVKLSSADTDAVTVSPATLMFTTKNWNTAQTVTLTGVQDNDGENEEVAITATPSGGGYDSSEVATYTATVTEDDSKDLTLSTSGGSFAEGATETYTVKLATLPTGKVIVALSSADTDAVTVSPIKLTFTTENWNTAQTVTLTGVQDDDGENESVAITATPSGGGYDSSEVATYTATVTEDDSKGLTLSASGSSFTEGATETYTVKLATLPTGKVTVMLSSADTDAVTVSPAKLTFTMENWNTTQTVTLTGVQDDDGENESVAVTATPSGGGYGSSEEETYTATVTEDDSKGLILSVSGSSFAEGATDTYTVKLATLPTGKVTVMLSSADTDAVTVSPATLTFTTENWNTAQTVTLTGVQDNDASDETVTVMATPSGGGYGSSETEIYTASVTETPSGGSYGSGEAEVHATMATDADGSKVLTLSASSGSVTEGSTGTYTVKLAMLPMSDVTVTLSSADTDAVTVSPATLTFTTENWNTAQTVTLTGVQDNDVADELVTVTATPSLPGGGYDSSKAATYTATVEDNDTEGLTIVLDIENQQNNVNKGTVYNVNKADSPITYYIKYGSEPATATCITPLSSDETVLKVVSPPRTFTTSNYGVRQSVTVEIMSDGSAEIVHWISSTCPVPVSSGASAQSGPLPSTGAGLNSGFPASPDVVVKVAAVVNASNRPPAFPAGAATDQSAVEDELFTYTVQHATDPDDGPRPLSYTAVLDGGSGNLPGWLSFDGNTRTFSGTPLEADTPATHQIQVTASDGEDSDAIMFTLTVEEVNDPPKFEQAAEDRTITEGKLFSYTVPAAIDHDHDEADLIYTAFVEQADGSLAPLPSWLRFDDATRTFSGTPGHDDAPSEYTLLVKVEDPEGLSDTTTFTLTVEALYNSRLPQVAKQWLARFGRTVSSQVVDAIADRLGDAGAGGGAGGRITVNGQSVSLSAGEASSGTAAKTDDATNGLSGADPFVVVSSNTKEALDEGPMQASPTARDLLLGSSFLIPLNPGGAMTAAVANDGGGGGGWTAWGEAVFTNFDGEDGDLSIDGEVLTGVVAIDWQRDRWLLGLALSQSEADGSFTAPETPRDDEIKGTVRSSLTTAHPYIRYRPLEDLEFWGLAGYGRGTMKLNADGEDPANPDIWLATIGIGGRAALLSPAESGGPTVDLTADVLLTRTGADADLPLRDAVDASTARLRVGVKSAWDWQGADGTSVVPTLSTALRYDYGDAETGLGIEIGAGVAYSNPTVGLTLSADIRGLLSRQEEDGNLGLREWGGSGSIQYDHDGDNLGLTASLSPSWGVPGSARDQLWSAATPPFATGETAASTGSARLDGEIGYGFAAFNGNATISPYAGLGLTDGSRDWRLGGRFSFLPGVDVSIEGVRRESETAAPDQSVQLQFDATW